MLGRGLSWGSSAQLQGPMQAQVFGPSGAGQDPIAQAEGQSSAHGGETWPNRHLRTAKGRQKWSPWDCGAVREDSSIRDPALTVPIRTSSLAGIEMLTKAQREQQR